jgi:hypothetical protein
LAAKISVYSLSYFTREVLRLVIVNISILKQRTDVAITRSIVTNELYLYDDASTPNLVSTFDVIWFLIYMQDAGNEFDAYVLFYKRSNVDLLLNASSVINRIQGIADKSGSSQSTPRKVEAVKKVYPSPATTPSHAFEQTKIAMSSPKDVAFLAQICRGSCSNALNLLENSADLLSVVQQVDLKDVVTSHGMLMMRDCLALQEYMNSVQRVVKVYRQYVITEQDTL